MTNTSCEKAKVAAGAVDFLSLAAAPIFATMALLTGVFGDGQPDILCLAGHHASALGGMVTMYVLMSVFHTAPWLKLISSPSWPPRTSTAEPATSGTSDRRKD
jgi:hypothetical protein